MPPRRTTRASSSSRIFDTVPNAAAVPGPAVHDANARGMSPGPAKFSSSYGSPPTIAPIRQNVARQRYNFASALNHVVDAVEKDNENDARERAQRDAEQQRRRATATLEPEVTSSPPPQEAQEKSVAGTARRSATPSRRRTQAPSGETQATPVRVTSRRGPDGSTIDFSDEDRVFAASEIFTPSLATAAGSRTSQSGVLQRIANAAQSMSTIKESPDDAAVRRAYPELRFIQPQPDPPATVTTEAQAPATRRSIVHTATKTAKTKTQRASRRSASNATTEEPVVAGEDGKGDEATSQQRLQAGSSNKKPEQEQPEEEHPEEEQEQPQKDPSKRPPKVRARSVWARLCHLGDATRALAMAMTVLVLSALAVRVFVISTAPGDLYSGFRVDNRLHWYGSDWRSNLRQFVPYVLVHPLGAISDEEFARMNGVMLSHAGEVAQMKHANRLHQDALDRIGRILPTMVHMELDKRGRPVIAQEFWHALKDCIQADRDIFTLLWGKDGSMDVSDLQWTALKRRLEASGMLPDASAKALSAQDVEHIAATALSKSWEAWLRSNQNKVRDLLGIDRAAPPPVVSAPEQPAADDRDLVDRLNERQLTELSRRMAASHDVRQVLVSRQDFLHLLQNTFVEHRLEIKGELADLEARVLDIARTAAAAAQPSASQSEASVGMSRREIMALVDQLVRKGISDAQLEAMARGTIAANLQTKLVKQVNFFTRNSGAVFNHHFSSPTYDPTRHAGTLRGFWDSVSDRTARPMPGRLRGATAFEPWEGDGDCWCAATNGSESNGGHDGRAQGSAIVAVKLGMRVLPQYLVVEHISPSATLDPGSMPKDLEVWAQITDYAAQRPLMDWSMDTFGEEERHHPFPFMGYGFIKIGVFSYESGSGGSAKGKPHGEAQVFRLSPDLEALAAVTDHVLVRATSNYGSKDHTCFYRLRLYGQMRPDEVV